MLMPHGAVFLEALVESPQLVFHLFNRAVQGRKNSIGLRNGHKFVVVLGPHPQLQHSSVLVFQIGQDRDGGQAVEEFPHYLDFFRDPRLRRRTQVAVAGRYGRLHRCSPHKADRPRLSTSRRRTEMSQILNFNALILGVEPGSLMGTAAPTLSLANLAPGERA